MENNTPSLSINYMVNSLIQVVSSTIMKGSSYDLSSPKSRNAKKFGSNWKNLFAWHKNDCLFSYYKLASKKDEDKVFFFGN